MPSNNNSTGSLEISSLSLPALNDRLRRIGLLLNASSGSTTASSSPSQIILSVPGTLGVQSDVAPILTLGASFQPKTLVAAVKRAPIGSALTMQVYVNGLAWGPGISIAAGTMSVTMDVSSQPAIAANQIIRLDITGVGALLTGVSFPGSDLSVILR